jgi:plasmid stabilization system protein ParE
MALTIKWSKKAKVNYDNVLAYLHENWSMKEVEKFINKTHSILTLISHQPYIFKASSHKRIRKAVIGKQNSLFYLVHESEVYLLSFWDNRMDPKKNKY